ncbi:MAG TPA: flotillin domain-containing protein, partial [Pseudomonadales bacterium]
VKPMEQISDIKILQVNGMNGQAVSSGADPESSGGSLADQMVNSALRYRAQAPLLDSLLAEIGLNGADINGITEGIKHPVNP